MINKLQYIHIITLFFFAIFFLLHNNLHARFVHWKDVKVTKAPINVVLDFSIFTWCLNLLFCYSKVSIVLSALIYDSAEIPFIQH